MSSLEVKNLINGEVAYRTETFKDGAESAFKSRVQSMFGNRGYSTDNSDKKMKEFRENIVMVGNLKPKEEKKKVNPFMIKTNSSNRPDRPEVKLSVILENVSFLKQCLEKLYA